MKEANSVSSRSDVASKSHLVQEQLVSIPYPSLRYVSVQGPRIHLKVAHVVSLQTIPFLSSETGSHPSYE